jgi:hypothetical protein
MRRHSRTRKTRHRGGNTSRIYTPPVVRTIAEEPKDLAEKMGDTVSGAVKATQASYIRNRDRVRQGTKGLMDNIRDFGNAITQKLGSLFGGRRRSRRHLKRSTRRHRRSRR